MRTFLSTPNSAEPLCAVSLAVFGVASWQAFLSDSPLAREALERGLVGDEKMQSVFGAVRLLGGTVEFAYIAQIAIALMAGGVLIYLCRVVPTRDKLGAAIVVATLLATPFLLPYDLVLLSIPLVWIMKESRQQKLFTVGEICADGSFCIAAIVCDNRIIPPFPGGSVSHRVALLCDRAAAFGILSKTNQHYRYISDCMKARLNTLPIVGL